MNDRLKNYRDNDEGDNDVGREIHGFIIYGMLDGLWVLGSLYEGGRFVRISPYPFGCSCFNLLKYRNATVMTGHILSFLLLLKMVIGLVF